MNRDDALKLQRGDRLYHRTERQAGGKEPLTVKVTGKIRTWKKDPAKIEIPTKRGLRDHHVITDRELDNWYTSAEDVSRFQEQMVKIQNEFGLRLTAAEIEENSIKKKKVEELKSLFVYALQHAMQESAEVATRGLLKLHEQKTVEDILDRYNRNLPPFRGAKERLKKHFKGSR